MLVSSPALAASAPKILSHVERVGPRKISASAPVAGVILGAPLAKIANPVLYVRGLSSADRTLCVTVERVDGAYSLDLVVDVRGAIENAAVRLPFGPQSPNFKEVRGLPAVQVAVLARASGAVGSCPTTSDFAPVSWQPNTFQPVHVQLLSRNASATLSAPGRPNQRCRGLLHVAPVEGQQTAFDTTCTITAPSCAKPGSINIRRDEDTGARLPIISAVLRGSC